MAQTIVKNETSAADRDARDVSSTTMVLLLLGLIVLIGAVLYALGAFANPAAMPSGTSTTPGNGVNINVQPPLANPGTTTPRTNNL